MPEKYLFTSPAPKKYLYTPEKHLYAPPEKYLYTSPAPKKPDKYLYIGLHLSNTVPGQKKAIVVFKYTSPATEKYLYKPCRKSIYSLLRRRRSIYIHRRSIYTLLRRRRSRRSRRSRRVFIYTRYLVFCFAAVFFSF